jgi:hypothetical protein
MALDPRTLAPARPKKTGSGPVVAYFDGGAPDTVFTNMIDGGTPSNTGPVLDGN